jgi:hypothetical protein
MDIQNLSDTSADTRRLRVAFTVALSFALLLWVLKLAEYLNGLDFTHLSTPGGLVGVLFAPFVHGSVYSYIRYSFSLLIGTALLVCGKYHIPGEKGCYISYASIKRRGVSSMN